MKLKKQLALLLTSVLLVGILAACGTSEKKDTNTADNKDKKVLVMGTSADYPPFEYVETSKSDEIKGFDIDIAKAIGKKLGYEVEVKDIDFNSLVPALENKSIDFVISGMTPTPKREQSVDFSDIYYTAKNMIVTTKDSKIKTVEDLKGKTVGVQLASIQETLATDLNKNKDIGMKVEKRNRIPEVVQEMSSGRFDAVIMEDTVAKGYLKDNKDLVGYVIESGEEDAGSAIAFQKGSKLTEEFNTELKKMLENGEMEKLILKWFGGSETE
ncbi:transporter substrate-binding domain-containing protein [Peribacillus butanolivorans]|uniref:ABC transporter substrate-binding protein n=1 Tax=Peribacillus butanolivorans TaxID=421767 RepID=A0ABN5MXH6_9BACI|nr:transporter substrate-binding domain-containing protein [Peribacillus butanolivorans]AXN37450.1 ABC transporter substrate-binding protein [Peribacillus butanolivorans]QNU04085.1 transporter substrate-binding domain-containing protein [Peribacillus butanolivorans]